MENNKLTLAILESACNLLKENPEMNCGYIMTYKKDPRSKKLGYPVLMGFLGEAKDPLLAKLSGDLAIELCLSLNQEPEFTCSEQTILEKKGAILIEPDLVLAFAGLTNDFNNKKFVVEVMNRSKHELSEEGILLLNQYL